MTVSVNTNPPLPGAISGETEPCAGSVQIYSIDPVSDATSYLWSIPSDWSCIESCTSNLITVTVGNNSGSITVNAKNSCGESENSNIAVIPQNCTCIPPQAPVNVIASDGTYQQQISIDWDEVSGATEYHIFRNGDSLTATIHNYFTDVTAPCSTLLYEVYSSNGTCRSEYSGNDTGYLQGCNSTTSLIFNTKTIINLYPNPAKRELFISFNTAFTITTNIIIYNALGKTVLIKQTNNKEIQSIDISDLPSGVYYLTLSADDKKIIDRFLVE